METLELRGEQIDGTIAEQFDSRMAVLVASGQLESARNIKKWRYSEVRLLDKGLRTADGYRVGGQ